MLWRVATSIDQCHGRSADHAWMVVSIMCIIKPQLLEFHREATRLVSHSVYQASFDGVPMFHNSHSM